MQDELENRFRQVLGRSEHEVDFCAVRWVEERSNLLAVRQDVVQPAADELDVGAMVTVYHGGGFGYGATSDLSAAGLEAAYERARSWAQRTAGCSVFDYRKLTLPEPEAVYETPVDKPWDSWPVATKLDLLRDSCQQLKTDPRIVDWEASLWRIRSRTLYLTSHGGRVQQTLHILVPNLSVTANAGTITQSRSLYDRGACQQGGLEILDRIDFTAAPVRLADEALQLVTAPNCPTGKTDLVLAADQMMLQIHESIGHPLELDRILGDERNYAGTTFVTPDMFGSYRYGSPLLNITYDPTRPEQLASFGYDDDGAKAQRTFIIEKGVLQRPLGSVISQARAGLSGVANSRASSWNRPPIDRMANLNLECGDNNLEALIGQVEHGLFMRTNCSWSIDDSRNKFQFGCEWGQRIEHGKLGEVVRNPCYRGVSATFWRNLAAVGDASTFAVLGTPFCGKGEPNQVIRVGHASPACMFRNVDVFGAE